MLVVLSPTTGETLPDVTGDTVRTPRALVGSTAAPRPSRILFNSWVNTHCCQIFCSCCICKFLRDSMISNKSCSDMNITLSISIGEQTDLIEIDGPVRSQCWNYHKHREPSAPGSHHLYRRHLTQDFCTLVLERICSHERKVHEKSFATVYRM